MSDSWEDKETPVVRFDAAQHIMITEAVFMGRAIPSVEDYLEGHLDFWLHPDFLWYHGVDSIYGLSGKITNQSIETMAGHSLCSICGADDLIVLRNAGPNRYCFVGFLGISDNVGVRVARRRESVTRMEVNII